MNYKIELFPFEVYYNLEANSIELCSSRLTQGNSVEPPLSPPSSSSLPSTC
jgi:hypothetical protein